jgi:hypothetical protein
MVSALAGESSKLAADQKHSADVDTFFDTLA